MEITSGLAPGYCAETAIVGGVKSGYCSTGSCNSDTIPPKTINSEITVAKIGRLIKNLENISAPTVP